MKTNPRLSTRRLLFVVACFVMLWTTASAQTPLVLDPVWFETGCTTRLDGLMSSEPAASGLLVVERTPDLDPATPGEGARAPRAKRPTRLLGSSCRPEGWLRQRFEDDLCQGFNPVWNGYVSRPLGMGVCELT